MIVEQKTKKAFVPVTITLETEEEVMLLKELTSFVDTKSIVKLKEIYYTITEDVTTYEIDKFSEDLFEELEELLDDLNN